jgi:hypothetical protein
MVEKSVLVGLHSSGAIKTVCEIDADARGYACDCASSFEEMLAKTRGKKYGKYYMDINFGRPNREDIEPARRIYELVRERVERGEADFLAVSANQDIATLAREAGIPSACKFDECADFKVFLGPLAD